jgi:hypothetical protein
MRPPSSSTPGWVGDRRAAHVDPGVTAIQERRGERGFVSVVRPPDETVLDQQALWTVDLGAADQGVGVPAIQVCLRDCVVAADRPIDVPALDLQPVGCVHLGAADQDVGIASVEVGLDNRVVPGVGPVHMRDQQGVRKGGCVSSRRPRSGLSTERVATTRDQHGKSIRNHEGRAGEPSSAPTSCRPIASATLSVVAVAVPQHPNSTDC